MELGDDAAQSAFRAELSSWLDANTPPELQTAGGPPQPANGDVPEWARQWQAALFDAGWLVPPWPRALGGRDADAAETLLYYEELARRRLRRTRNFQGLNIVAPTLRDFGTPAQQEQWLVPTLRAELLWCIGMSEPGAGSDLGSLTTRADQVDGGFVVNGSKVWTSSAHLADWCLLYVRTGPAEAAHRAISVLAVDMRSPGVDARPFAHMTGDVDFAEVFFTDVFVPGEHLVGGLHEGWALTVASLAHERSGLWVQGVADLETYVSALVDLARRTGRLDDPVVRRDLAWADEQVASLRALGYAGAAADSRGGAEHSLLKLAAAELGKSLSELGLRLLGPWGTVDDEPERLADGTWSRSLMTSFAATIAGGTSEIQRTIIAERILRMPRAGARA